MNAIGKKWMAKDLYEICSICDGECEIAPSKFSGSWTPEMIPDGRGNAVCPGCSGEGYIKIGLTVGQLERLKAERDKYKGLIEAANKRA